jgi:hypothetical protein
MAVISPLVPVRIFCQHRPILLTSLTPSRLRRGVLLSSYSLHNSLINQVSSLDFVQRRKILGHLSRKLRLPSVHGCFLVLAVIPHRDLAISAVLRSGRHLRSKISTTSSLRPAWSTFPRWRSSDEPLAFVNVELH